MRDHLNVQSGRGRVALVTGAEFGLGAALAEALADRGWRVVRGVRTPERAESWPSGSAIVLDVTDDMSVAEAMAAVEAWAGRIELLVCCAATVEFGPVLALSVSQFERVVDVNLLGVVRCTRAVLAGMVEKGGGIWVVASGWGRCPSAGTAAYAASKAAVAAFAEALANEVGDRINVRVVYPGFMPGTALTRRALASGLQVPPRCLHVPPSEAARRILARSAAPALEVIITPAERWGLALRVAAPRLFRRATTKWRPFPAAVGSQRWAR